MKSTINERCEEKGLRMTDQRRIIARILDEAEDHPDVEDLYARAAAVDPRISIATVYRTVKLFEEAGILERREFGDGQRVIAGGRATDHGKLRHCIKHGPAHSHIAAGQKRPACRAMVRDEDFGILGPVGAQ